MFKAATRLGALALAAFLTGCSGGFATVAPTPPDVFKRLGHTEGEACGTMFLLSTGYNFLPVMLNDRVQRAYDVAVHHVRGATALVDVTVTENWYWWVLGTTRCTTVAGEAIK